MIQLQALNYIISKKDAEFLIDYDVRYYSSYPDEYKFILKHYQDFKSIPDISTVLGQFNDFDPLEITESRQYIETKLYEDYVYNSAVNIINNSESEFSKNAIMAKDNIIQKLQELVQPKRSYGKDIIKNAKERYDMLLAKQLDPDRFVFSTGLEELDFLLGGGLIRGEELIALYARTNNAKTWIAEKLAVAVWEAGNNVGFFSPEMSDEMIGYRFDTLFKHFDNHGIMGSDRSFKSDDYLTYINTLISKDRPVFSVTSPLNFPDKRVTVSEIKKWVMHNDLKMIVIDGLSYMTNERGNGKKNTTENLTEISEDLMILSKELKIPIVVVIQANREAARDSNGEVNQESPELDTIRGSDGISHNASRAISIYKSPDGIIKLYISKNRYGEKGQKLLYQYDINFGKFTYIPNPKDGMPHSEDESDTSLRDQFKDDKAETQSA